MSDEHDLLDLVRRNPYLDGIAGRVPKEKGREIDSEEGSCPAFGYLRGLRERALAVEFRFRNGNRDWFPYNWLGPGGTTRPSGCCSSSPATSSRSC